jgi:hypothetical protein
VVVPHLGGFVTNYKPARIDDKGRAFPPRKDISFNRNLTGSDGLLEKKICEEEGITFEVASEKIRSEVTRYWQTLNGGSRLEFKKVGVLYIDTDKNLRFEPDTSYNYLISSFGLDSFELPPRITKPEEKEAKVLPLTPAHEQKKSHQDIALEAPKESRSIYWVAAAALLPFFAFSIYTGLRTNFKSPTEVNVADLNPLFSQAKEPSLYSERNEVVMETSSETSDSFPENEEIFRYSFAENDSTTVWVDLREVSETNKIIQKGPYHIIAGCFGEEANAVNYVRRLQSRGYEASILDYHKNLHRVKISSFNAYQDALNELHTVRNNGTFPNAWMLKKK